MKTTTTKGFTIVELLIVIVVIAILAAITLVSYNGIQQRAKNIAIISAASQSMELIRAYIALEGDYPLHNETACLTDLSGCAQADRDGVDPPEGDAELTASLMKIGTLPRAVPKSGNDKYGIMFTEKKARWFNGNKADSALIFYYLNGINQDCGMTRVADTWDNSEQASGPMPVPADENYTVGDYGGKTLCYVSVPRS